MVLLVIMMFVVLVIMMFVVTAIMLLVVSVCIVSMIVPPSPAQSRPYFVPPTLMAAQSFKLCLQLVLHQNRKDAQQSKHDQEEDRLHRDGVHGGGQLLKGSTSLNENEGRRSHPKEGAHPEGKERNPYHRRDNVDEPVG